MNPTALQNAFDFDAEPVDPVIASAPRIEACLPAVPQQEVSAETTFFYFPRREVTVSSADLAVAALRRHRDHAQKLLTADRRAARDETFALRSLASYQSQLTALIGHTWRFRIGGNTR